MTEVEFINLIKIFLDTCDKHYNCRSCRLISICPERLCSSIDSDAILRGNIGLIKKLNIDRSHLFQLKEFYILHSCGGSINECHNCINFKFRFSGDLSDLKIKIYWKIFSSNKRYYCLNRGINNNFQG